MRGAVVYPRVETIFARKKDGQLYRHDFDSAAPLIGEADGSLRIPGGPRKWARIDGEPWMVNAPVDKRRKRRAGRRRRKTKKTLKVRAAKRGCKTNHALAVYALANRPEGDTQMARHRNRKGQFSKGGGGGRRRGRRRGHRRTMRTSAHTPIRYRSSRRRSRRRSYRRNPPIARGFLGRLVPPIEPVLTAVVGATATRFLANQLEGWFPNLVTSTHPATGVPAENKMARAAIKVAAALLAGVAGGMVMGRARGSQLAAGGLVIVTDEFVRSNVLPAVGLSEYIEPYEYVEAYVGPPGGGYGADESGVPGQAMLSTYDDGDLSAFMEEDFMPGRLNPESRLN